MPRNFTESERVQYGFRTPEGRFKYFYKKYLRLVGYSFYLSKEGLKIHDFRKHEFIIGQSLGLSRDKIKSIINLSEQYIFEDYSRNRIAIESLDDRKAGNKYLSPQYIKENLILDLKELDSTEKVVDKLAKNIQGNLPVLEENILLKHIDNMLIDTK
ncbi:MAG TPA: hypothetical protein VJU85_06080 [Nitrososphaeraceae archaeon]|nr:hypothetical protein [Nitrososphaeraceae archaeon]